MATTVGQHSVAAFTSPINGTTPIDANTVRSNDNTVRLAYVDHDADTGIHVQSSNLASRPIAGTAGRKWITEESGVYTLWFDDGVNWHPVSSEAVALTVLCTTALNRGDVVKIVGWNNGQDLPEVAKVASSSDIAFAVMTQNATINTMGYATNTGMLQDIATNTFSVGDILYPNTTGGFTATKPTSGLYQPVAFVLRSNATNGVIYVEFSAPRIVEASTNTASTVVLRDGSGNFSAGTITANLTGNITGTAPAGTLTGTTLASNVVSSSLTSVGTLSTLTVSGNLTVDTNTLVVDATNNRVGVGTVSPASALEVNGAVRTGADASSVSLYTNTGWRHTGSSGLYIDANQGGAANSVFIRNGSGFTTQLTLDASGNLGLGTTPNTWATGTEAVQIGRATALWNPDSASSSILLTNAYNDGAYKYINTAAASYYRQNGAAHEWHSAASGTAGNTIAFTQAMTLDASGRLGIGVTSPGVALDVQNVSTTQIRAVMTGVNGAETRMLGDTLSGAIGTYSNHEFAIKTNALTVAVFSTSGNLGLGVTPSAWSSIQGGAFQTSGAGAIWSTGVTDVFLSQNAFFNGSYRYVSTNAASAYRQLAGVHQWFTAPSGTAGNAISFTQAMTLDASGNLGIGIASPSTRIHAVGGNIRLDSTSDGNNGILQIRDTAASTVLGAYALSTAAWFGVTEAKPLIFFTSGTERARIDSAGNLLVGMTAIATSSAKTLHLANATVPTANPTGGGVLYVEAGALKYRGSSGTITTIANA